MARPSRHDYAVASQLREALLAFLRASERITEKHGLTEQRYQLLLMIKTARDGNERASQQELRERLHLAQSSLAELVQRAEGIGLVRRELSPANRRLVYVALTPEGERRLAAAVADLAGSRERLSASLASLTPDV